MSLLAENVKRIKEARNLTTKDIAKKAGLNKCTVTNIIKDRCEPHKETIRRIANAFSVSEEQIMNEEITQEASSIGGKIKMLYKKHHMTQKQLAEKTGIEQHTISNITRGKNKPQKRTLVRIAEAFGMTVEELMDYKE